MDNSTTFALALDSDRVEYGGNGLNPDSFKSKDGQLEFYLSPYAVMGFVQQDNLVIPTGVGEIPEPNYTRCNGYYYYCRYGAYGAR